MKANITVLAILIALLPLISNSQDKEIKGVPLTEASKLTISAKAETLSNVTFYLNPSEGFDKDKVGFEFPVKLEINPLNQKTFRDNFLKSLIEVAKYQQNTDSLKNFIDLDKRFSDWLQSVATITDPSNVEDANTNEKTTKCQEDDFKKLEQLLSLVFSDELKEQFFKGLMTQNKRIEKLHELIKYDVTREDLQKVIVDIDNARLKDLLDNDLTDDLEDIGNGRGMDDPEQERKYLKGKEGVDNVLNSLYRFFDGQLVLLFQFDTEPVAGKLYFNKLITRVQYFTQDSDELLLKKRVVNYHGLVKELHQIQKKDLDSLKSNETLTQEEEDRLTRKNYRKDSITSYVDKYLNQLKDSINNVFDKNKEERENWYWSDNELDYDQNLLHKLESVIKYWNKEKTYSNLISVDEIRPYLPPRRDIDIKVYDKDERQDLNDQIENIIAIENRIKTYLSASSGEANKKRKDLIDQILDTQTGELFRKYTKNPFNIYFANKTFEYFKKNKEFKNKYLENPLDFYKNFKNIVDKFEIYTRKERLELIERKLLNLKNTEVYNLLGDYIEEYDFATLLKKDNESKVKILDDLINWSKGLEDIEKLRQIDFDIAEKEYRKKRNTDIEYFKDKYKELGGSLLRRDSEQVILGFLGDEKNFIQNPNDYEVVKNRIQDYNDLKSDLRIRKESIDKGYDNQKIQHLSDLKKSNSNKYFKEFAGEDLDKAIKETRNDLKISFLEIYNDEIRYNGKVKSLELLKSILAHKIEFSGQKEALRKIRNQLHNASLWDIEAKSINLDFNDGFIEHIVIEAEIKALSEVNVDNKNSSEINKRLRQLVEDNSDWETNLGKILKFTNQFPYGFSSRIDYEDIKGYELAVTNNGKKRFVMNMEAIFPEYSQRLANDRLDFSPKDQAVQIDLNSEHSDTNNKLQLKKEVSSRLFDIKIFTDFIGFGSDPNGMAQFEFDRIIPIHTKRFPIGPRRTLQTFLGRSFNWGYFNYLRPEFRWARLNTADDVENLTASTQRVFNGGVEDILPFVTILDLLRYENISVGVDLNFFSFDVPNSKFRAELNGGGRFGRTRVIVPENTETSMMMQEQENQPIDVDAFTNTWRYYPEILFRLRPEERYGASLAARYIRFNTQTTNFSTVSSESRFRQNLSDDPQWLWQFAIDAHFSPTARNDNRFFFRYRYSNNRRFETNGFSELQLGYVISLRPRISN